MLRKEIVALLASVSPLDRLPEEELDRLSDAALDYYPRNSAILEQGGSASDFLYLIKRGTVRLFLDSGDSSSTVLDYRGEGEYFGLISVVSGDAPRASVVAEEDTICLLIPRARLLDVLERNPSVSDKLLRSYFIDFIDKTYDETRRKYQAVSNNHRILFSTAVGELIRRDPVTASGDLSVQGAARRMVEHGISCIVVVGPDEAPAGIVTDRDLREKVVASGRSPRDPIAEIMSSPLISVEAKAPCSEALLAMMRHNIHHVLVVENGRFRGMVTNHDFMVLQGTSPTLLVRKVSAAPSLARLAEESRGLDRVVGILSREGAKAEDVSFVITEVTDRVLLRAEALIAREAGPAPQPFALAVCGQAGRRELSLHRHLVLVAVLDEAGAGIEMPPKTLSFFDRLGRDLRLALAPCGISVEAGFLSPERVGAPSEWIARLEDWLTAANASGLMPEILDMRTVCGESRLVEDLRANMMGKISGDERLLGALASRALGKYPPLGFLRRFVVDGEGDHRNELDLFDSGIRPLVDALRVLACEEGIMALSTRERLAGVRELHPFLVADEVESALEYLQTLRVHQQLASLDAQRAVNDFLRPEELTRRERKTLKHAFQLSGDLLDQLRRRYEP